MKKRPLRISAYTSFYSNKMYLFSTLLQCIYSVNIFAFLSCIGIYFYLKQHLYTQKYTISFLVPIRRVQHYKQASDCRSVKVATFFIQSNSTHTYCKIHRMYFSYSIGKITFPLSNTKKLDHCKEQNQIKLGKGWAPVFYLFSRAKHQRSPSSIASNTTLIPREPVLKQEGGLRNLLMSFSKFLMSINCLTSKFLQS